MQVELLNRRRWKTRIEPANAIFEYLEVLHNRRRRPSALGMRTPIEYEMLHPTDRPWHEVNQPDSTELGAHLRLR
jgi:putative transposase